MASALDVFHTKNEACKALAINWNQVERDWDAYDQAIAQARKDQRTGIDSRSAALKATRAWAMVVKSFDPLRKGGNLSFSPRLAEDQGDLGATQQASRRRGGRSGQGQLFSMPPQPSPARGEGVPGLTHHFFRAYAPLFPAFLRVFHGN